MQRNRLDAVRNDYPIGIYRQPDGTAVITWDRQSHGNQPAVTADADDYVSTSYNIPKGLMDHYREARPTATAVLRQAVRTAPRTTQPPTLSDHHG